MTLRPCPKCGTRDECRAHLPGVPDAEGGYAFTVEDFVDAYPHGANDSQIARALGVTHKMIGFVERRALLRFVAVAAKTMHIADYALDEAKAREVIKIASEWMKRTAPKKWRWRIRNAA